MPDEPIIRDNHNGIPSVRGSRLTVYKRVDHTSRRSRHVTCCRGRWPYTSGMKACRIASNRESLMSREIHTHVDPSPTRLKRQNR